MKYTFVTLSFALVLALAMNSCSGDVRSVVNDMRGGTSVETKHKDYSFNGVKPLQVDEIPPGFLPLKDVAAKNKSVVSIGFFESTLYIKDSDGITIKQVMLSDSSFLVQYEDDLYLNEERNKEILNLAQNAFDEKSKTFELKEIFWVYDRSQNHLSMSVEETYYLDKSDSLEVDNYEKLFVIKLSTTNFSKGNFYYLETASGNKYSDIAIISGNTVVVKVKKDDKMRRLYVKSLYYPENVRKVLLY